MCKPLDFNNDEHKILLNRIMSGNIVLFLGSGFSIGATGNLYDEEKQKLPLPNVKQLKKILCDKVLYTSNSEESLKDICEDCQEDNLSRYASIMRDLFRVSSVKEFHKLYTKIDWKIIFTINVDDIIEYVYDEANKKYCSIYSENPLNADRGTLHYYKLHGCAKNSPENITFSVSDYITSAAKKHDCRFEDLSSALKTENFLFVGTSLNEEWDFDIQCQNADVYTINNKTYFILKEYDNRLIKRIRRKFKNPVLIQETAESFIRKVLEFIDLSPAESRFTSYERWNFRQIKKENYNVQSYLKPDLYLGAEPTWEDIFSNHDVIWNKTQETIKQLKTTNNNIITLIIGKPVSGKTSLLYRLAASLCETNIVLEYEGDNFIDDLKMYGETYNKTNDQVIILLDDANWILGRIQNLMQILENTNLKLIASVREKEYEKRQHLFDDIINSKINLVKKINELTIEDYVLYLDKLNEKSFLGQYSKDYHTNKNALAVNLANEIRNKKQDPLLMLAFKMNYGDKLEKRIDEISNTIIKHNNYNIKRFSVLLFFLDIIGDTGLRLSLFLDLYPMKTDELRQFFLDIKDLLISNINQKSLENLNFHKITIHGRFSEILKKVISKISDYELEELVEDIFRRMDNIYHFKCRQANTYQNYVLYTLLRSQNISELFRNSTNSGEKWQHISRLYEHLHDFFSDYHLYWLHRGISEVKMKKFPTATIHLQQARVTRQNYSYEIEHSFAMLYFEQSIHSKNLCDSDRMEQLNKALSIIRLQIERRENDAFTIHSFIIKTIQFYKNINQIIPDNLMKEMFQYYYLARKRFKFDQSKIRRNMLMCIFEYLSTYDGKYKYSFSITQEELKYLNKRIGTKEIDYNILDCI